MAPAKVPKKWGSGSNERARLNFFRSARPYQNEENLARLKLKESDFSTDLEKIRKAFKIPSGLKAHSDGYSQWVSVDDGDVDLMESRWVDNQDAKQKRRLEKAIEALLAKHKLTVDFYDITRYWLLYREVPPAWTVSLASEHMFYIISQPSEAQRIPLNSTEKKLLLAEFRRRLGIKVGRVPKKYAPAYGQLSKVLARSKNKSRRFRTLKTALMASGLEGQYFFDKNRKKMNSKKTYLDLVGEMYPVGDVNKLPSIKKDRRIADKVRHHKSRFTKRNREKR